MILLGASLSLLGLAMMAFGIFCIRHAGRRLQEACAVLKRAHSMNRATSEMQRAAGMHVVALPSHCVWQHVGARGVA